jgi:dTDP-4-dehydrorhamnose 3,5-epimerase
MLNMIQHNSSQPAGLVHGSWIAGAGIRPLDRQEDARGSFMEIYRKAWAHHEELAQMSVVHSRPGTLRGMHLHLRHDESICVLSGEAYVGLRDIREGSSTEGVSMLIRLDGSQPSVLFFPAGIVHGWLFTAETLHVQGVSEDYGSYGGDDNHGCHWSDPKLDLPWPVVPTNLAARAAAFGSLDELIAVTRRA